AHRPRAAVELPRRPARTRRRRRRRGGAAGTAAAAVAARPTAGVVRTDRGAAVKPSVEPEIVDALTVDVEDYFQVSALEAAVPRSAWGTMECRVERKVERLLSIFDEHGARATFFTLGWIAERWPRVVRS